MRRSDEDSDLNTFNAMMLFDMIFHCFLLSHHTHTFTFSVLMVLASHDAPRRLLCECIVIIVVRKKRSFHAYTHTHSGINNEGFRAKPAG